MWAQRSHGRKRDAGIAIPLDFRSDRGRVSDPGEGVDDLVGDRLASVESLDGVWMRRADLLLLRSDPQASSLRAQAGAGR